MLKIVCKTLMMPLNVVKNGDKFMIESLKLSTKNQAKNGILAPILFSPQLKLLFKDALNLFKFVKDNFNSLLKEETQFYQSLEGLKLNKLLEFYNKSKDLLANLSRNLRRAKRKRFLMLRLQTGMMNTMLLNLESKN